MLRAATVRLDRDHPFSGFQVAYEQDELQFPVWILIILASTLFYVFLSQGNVVLLLLSFFPAAFAFHSFPLLETGKTRVAANQNCLFVDGLGRIEWRFIGDIGATDVIVRGNVYREAAIALLTPLATALCDDARGMPFPRRLMRKPFYLLPGPIVRLPLDIFDHPPEETIASLRRIWIYNRAKQQANSSSSVQMVPVSTAP